MRAYDSATLTQLGKKRAAMRYLLRFEFDSGIYGFWAGTGTITYQGVTYVGAGRLLDIEELGGGLDFAAQAFKVSLSSKPNSALTPDVLATVFSEAWHQKPAILYKAFFHPRTRALLSIERAARRVLDTLPLEQVAGGQAKLTAFLEPVTFDNPRRGYAKFGDADQRLIDPDDAFFSFAATAGEQPIEWGRAPQAAAAGAGRPVGGPG
jgi:hypothetical protein